MTGHTKERAVMHEEGHDRSALAVERCWGSVADMTRYCGFSEGMIRSFIRAGTLKAHKVGRRVLISYLDMDEFIRYKAH